MPKGETAWIKLFVFPAFLLNIPCMDRVKQTNKNIITPSFFIWTDSQSLADRGELSVRFCSFEKKKPCLYKYEQAILRKPQTKKASPFPTKVQPCRHPFTQPHPSPAPAVSRARMVAPSPASTWAAVAQYPEPYGNQLVVIFEFIPTTSTPTWTKRNDNQGFFRSKPGFKTSIFS